MVSTFLSYRLYTADMAKSVARTLSDAQVSREATYYRDNIGKIGSVDDFLKDQRLYAYAMKAHGLEDMTYAKAFMRKVLESDLSDADSFVRKLVDQRYVAFARAFNFTETGEVAASKVAAQDVGDEAETVGLYSESRVRQGAAVATEVEYYKSRIGTITSVDQLVSDQRMVSFALKSFGLDPDIASMTTIRKVLTSDLSDPASAANALNDVRYQNLASAFSFEADGSVAAGAKAQTSSKVSATIYLHYDATGNSQSPAAAAFKTDVFRDMMASVTSVDDLLNNEILRSYALTAAGIDPILVSDTTLRAVLTSDLDDPNSPANSLASYRTLATSFNFNAEGALDAGQSAQSTAQQDALADLYLANYDAAADTSEVSQTEYYKINIAAITTIDELLKDTRLFNYVLTAFDLDPSEESKSKIRQVLQSDSSNILSFANRLRDPRYTALAAAFNFGADGTAQGAIRAQLASPKAETITRYTASLGTAEADQARGVTESEYYSATIDTIKSADELIKDTRLVTYIKKAFGFDGQTITDQTLKQIFTSDVFDPKSFVNTAPNTKYRELAAAFNFATDGAARRVSAAGAQDQDDLVRTQDLYIRQTMEEQAGDQNEGVRLALYFQRKAATITSPYSILADKALLEVVMTALAMPDAVAQADVDMQAKMIEKRIDLEDFKDPAKVEKFLARFTALYDLENPQTNSVSVPSLLIGQQQGASFGVDLLTSIQSLRRRF